MEDEATSSSTQQYAQEGVLPHNSIPHMARMASTDFKSPCARLAWLTYQGKEKHINAQKDVLSTYHDSYLYGKVPLTIKVRAAIRGWPLSTLLLWLEFLAAMVSVVLYIISTYTVARITEEKEWIRVVEFACGLFFVVDYLIKVYSAPVRLYYIFSGRGLVDIISTIPILFSLSARERYSGAEILLFLRALRVMPVITSVGGFTGSIREQIFILVMYTLGVVFIAGGLLQWVEYRATPQSVREKLNCRPEGCMSFFEALYFMIVTVSTVGYGDVTLKSDWGRVVIVCAIVTALVILPLQINGILQLASRRPYGGNFAVKKVVGSRFIIVSGYLSYRTIQDFLAEFYHPNHNKDLRAFPLRVVVMAPFKPSFELKSLLMYYKGKAEFIEGTPVKGSDLNRVSADVASAFYLLANQQAKDPDAEDAAQIVRALSVYRHCGSGVRVIVELLKPEKQNNAVWDDTKEGIEIVCPDVIRFKLLARSCHVKGLSTFIVNLFRTGLTMTKPNKWMEQYGHGLCQEVFPVILPDCFHQEGFLFEQVAELAYCGYGIILFGLDISTKNYNSYQGREVLLCPIGRTIQVTDVGLVIAKNLEAAEALSKFSRSCHAEEHSDIPNHATMTSHCASYKMQTRPSGPRSMSLNTTEETTLLPGMTTTTFGEVELIDVEESRIECLLNLPNPPEEVSERQRGRQSHNLKLLEPSIQLNGKGSSKSSFAVNVHHAESLEEMMNFAMSWPPLQKDTKPEQPVLEQQTQKIQANLDERKLHIVKLQEPHILLCIQGKWPVSLFYFMQLLRTPAMPNSPIVILHPNDPKIADWGCVGLFAHVYFVKGSPLYELDLLRAGVMQAEKVVILTQGIQLEQNSLEIANDQDRLIPSQTFSLDVNNLIIAATVERLLVPSIRVMVELQQEAEIQYLRPKLQFDRKRFDQGMYRRNQAATFQFAPPYIEGKGFCPATLGFLMYATFYNRHTVTIVEQLLCGGTGYSATKGGKGNTTHNYTGSGNPRKLDQIHVPEEYVGKTFKEAFVGMLMNGGIMALGLYRAQGTSGSIVSFVYTNPSPSTILFHDDLIYAIC